MKKINVSGKLHLNKETISRLNDAELHQIKGGDFTSFLGDKCNDEEPAPNSSPDNLETCEGETCVYLDGC